MSVNVTVLLATAGLAVAAGTVALLCARGMRRELAALRREVAGLCVPGPRAAPGEIRTAVAHALADERERELAEARAFWTEQEAREARENAADPGYARGGFYGAAGEAPADGLADYEVPPVLPFLPRQADFAGLEPEAPEVTLPEPGAIPHPSGPDFTPGPTVASQDQTADRLSDLADARIPLSDVRPGPLGTLDVYVFSDGTTLCMTPGHRETALRLQQALDAGEVPVLRGGSAIAGAYTLTFGYGEESVYVLADRVVASL